jgi:hypothetical protein
VIDVKGIETATVPIIKLTADAASFASGEAHRIKIDITFD